MIIKNASAGWQERALRIDGRITDQIARHCKPRYEDGKANNAD